MSLVIETLSEYAQLTNSGTTKLLKSSMCLIRQT